MNAPVSPSVRLHLQSQGQGRPLLSLHSSSGSHAQWRALAELLTRRGGHQLLMPDLHGHGRSPAWPAQAADSLRIDALAALACLDGVEEPVDLVGHSYGGAVALQLALLQPQRVRSLLLYEPVAFGLLRRYEPQGEAWQQIRRIAAMVADKPREEAARLFTDYWSGGSGWLQLNTAQQATIAERIATVSRHFNALFAADWGRPELQRLRMPVLLVGGVLTREPARRVSELLAAWLPDARQHWLTRAGHLGPLTHASQVAELIADFVQREPAAA
ncbi:alpha/beta fold hydrolase [Roseateles violae]|uniref:Alpha/beta fold hydrolase n=1 Tax=Roseateles violae TaxID=3058042 RepID=A0ABT8DMM9_9BURK|nr:alpha/beta fold hydrolase [Pelomonas sp. PFR6]MDN3919193.1 alpha/beta fold hydrolase [Pelomonas sp. PFR6]